MCAWQKITGWLAIIWHWIIEKYRAIMCAWQKITGWLAIIWHWIIEKYRAIICAWQYTRPEKKDDFIKWFDRNLTCAVWWAWVIALLYCFSNFLDFCILCYFTWVFIRTFVPSQDLLRSDFLVAVGMLLVGGARCVSASFFMRLLVHPLAFQSQAPTELRHSIDGHYPCTRTARYVSAGAQFSFAGLNLAFFLLFPKYLNAKLHDETIQFLFYAAFVNFIVGCLTLAVYLAVFKCLSCRSSRQESILRYFDTVLERAISSGLVGAQDFEFFRFAYTQVLAGDFSRSVQPQAVAKNHEDMNKYLYYHRLGPNFLLTFMEDKDAWVQLAAVNIVGFWADQNWGVGLPESEELKLPRELPKKLADKVGTGQVGWAATTSIGVLAARSSAWANKLKQTKCGSNEQSLPGYLADMIDADSNRSLSAVRTLVQLYEQLCETADNEQGPPEPFTNDEFTKLLEKLQKLAKSTRVHRFRVQAAYLLILLKGEPRNGSMRGIVENIDPSVDTYWFQSEVKMLELLDSRLGIEKVRPEPKRTESADREINPPSWVKTQPSSSVAQAT